MSDQKSFLFRPLPVGPPEPPKPATRPNLIIEAGAGTGKTTRIVKEVVELLLRDPSIVLERIVLMTFTEKAAGEIADRIRAAITDLSTTLDTSEPRWPSDPGKPAILVVRPDEIETARAACAAHLPEIDRLRSQTIHSFCQNILRAYPIEAGLTPQFRIAEGYERGRLLAEIYGEWLETELSPETPDERIAEWRLLYRHFLGLNRFGEILERLLPVADLIRDETLTLGDPEAVDSVLRKALERIRALSNLDVKSIEDEVQATVVRYVRSTRLPDDASIEDWISWLSPIEQDLALMKLNRGKKAVTDLLKPLRGEKPEKAFPARLRRHRVAEVLRSVAIRYFDFVEQAKEERGVVDFDDLLVRTARVLDDPRILAEVRGRYDYVFVDEFQDTDRIQARIVDRIARDRREMFVPGKVTLVGDPKQSIYAFRSADPETYRDTLEAFSTGDAKREYLGVQHRSDPILLESLNLMFGALFADRGERDPNVFRPVYGRLEAARSAMLPDNAPRVRFVLTPPPPKRNDLSVEADALASWIAARRTGEPGELRKIAILMRRGTHFQLFADALERRGIPAIMPPAGSFLDQPAVVDLTAVLRAVSHGFDRAAQISAARSPCFALTDDEIFAHWFSCGKGTDDRCPFAAVLSTIHRWQRDARHMSVLETVDRILEETPVETLHDVTRGGAIARAHVDRLLELAATFDVERGGSLAEFVDELAARRDQYAESEPPGTEEEADAVRIMTIHASKGLEFHTVILSDLTFGGRSDDLAVFATNAPRHLVFSGNVESISAWAHLAPGGEELRDVKSNRQRAEEERLLYVAATRAKAELVFVTAEGAESTGGFLKYLHAIFGKEPIVASLSPAGTPVSRSLPVSSGEGVVDVWVECASPDDAAVEPPPITDAASAAMVGGLSGIVPLEARHEPVVERAVVLDRSEAARAAAGSANRIAGILLHRVLELWNGETEGFEAPLSTAAVEIGAELGEIELVRRRLQRIESSPVLARLRDMETVGREITVHYVENGRVKEGRIDRLVREGERLWVLDYKSGKPESVRLEHDRSQVRRYCEHVAGRGGAAVSGLLWYVDIETDELVDVEC